MESPALASSCLTISRIADSVVAEIDTIISKFRNVPFIVRSLQTHLKMIKHHNDHLDNCLSQESTVFTAEEVEILSLSLWECEAAIGLVRQHVQPLKDKSALSIFKKAKYSWNESLLKEFEERLKTQLAAQQQLIQICQLPPQERDSVRQDQYTRSVLLQARDCAAIYAFPSSQTDGTLNGNVQPGNSLSNENERAGSNLDQRASIPLTDGSSATPIHSRSYSSGQAPANETGLTDRTALAQSHDAALPRSVNRHSSPKPKTARLTRSSKRRYSEQLGQYAQAGKATELSFRIKEGADVNYQDGLGQTPLHRAVSGNQLAIVELLLKQGADASIPDQDKITPLHLAVSENLLATVELLLKSGARPNLPDRSGDTPLHYAVTNDFSATVKLLMKSGANPNLSNKSGYTPLHLCAESNSPKSVPLLVAGGADLEKSGLRLRLPTQTEYSQSEFSHLDPFQLHADDTVLHIATRQCSYRALKALLHAGSLVDAFTNDTYKVTPITIALMAYDHWDRRERSEGARATRRKYRDIITELLSHGADMRPGANLANKLEGYNQGRPKTGLFFKALYVDGPYRPYHHLENRYNRYERELVRVLRRDINEILASS